MANQQLSPGLAFSEPTSGVANITAAADSIGCLIGTTKRGPVNTAVLVGSYEQYVQIFGPAWTGSYMDVAVQGFFDCGGQSVYIIRVGHYTTITDPTTLDGVAATYQLQGDGPASTALMSASSMGTHGNELAFTTTRDNTLIANTVGSLAASAQTSAVLSDLRRVYVGAQLLLADATTPSNKVRVVVTRLDTSTNTIYFPSATPSGTINTAGNVTLEEWTLKLYRNGNFLEALTQNAMAPTAPNYFFSNINNGDPVRQVVITTDNGLAASNTVDPRPLALTAQHLTTTLGSDGTTPIDADYVGSSASKTGLYALDVVDDCSMLAIPGRNSATVHQAEITYCENRTTITAILVPNQGLTPAQCLTYVQTTANLFSSYAAIYYLWGKITDKVTGMLTLIPTEGHHMGVWARTAATRGLQKTPAGTPDGRLTNVLAAERKLSRTDQDSLYQANINYLLAPKGKGVLAWGARTLSNGDLQPIGRRRVFNFVKTSLNNSMLGTVFEDNDETTRAAVRKAVGKFLLVLWRDRKMFKGKKPQDAFFVLCDSTNNPPSLEESGKLKCRVGMAIARAAEFVEFELVLDTRAVDAELAAAGIF